MKQIYDDLWQTRLEIPFSNVQSHAYFLQCIEVNVLIYNTSHAEEIKHITEMGGIKYQYLSHRDETGASLQTIKDQFGSELCCHAKEEPFITESCPVDVIFTENIMHSSGIDVIQTPGHTNGSISFQFNSLLGCTYLFTGDTIFQSNGHWNVLTFPEAGGSDEALLESLLTYRELKPNVVISSASGEGEASFVEVSEKSWKEDIDKIIKQLNK